MSRPASRTPDTSKHPAPRPDERHAADPPETGAANDQDHPNLEVPREGVNDEKVNVLRTFWERSVTDPQDSADHSPESGLPEV